MFMQNQGSGLKSCFYPWLQLKLDTAHQPHWLFDKAQSIMNHCWLAPSSTAVINKGLTILIPLSLANDIGMFSYSSTNIPIFFHLALFLNCPTFFKHIPVYNLLVSMTMSIMTMSIMTILLSHLPIPTYQKRTANSALALKCKSVYFKFFPPHKWITKSY